MKFKQYIEMLQKFIEENPETSEYEAIYSEDDEGNGFGKINFSPTKGVYEYGEFITEANLEDEEMDPSEMNAVCVN